MNVQHLATGILPPAGTNHSTEELAKTVETYRALMQASNTGTWEYNVNTGWLDCNDIYFSMLGRSIKDFDLSGVSNLAATWINLLHPDDVENATSRFSKYLDNPIAKMYESFFRLLHVDGSWLWIWSRGRYILDDNGNNTNKIIGTHTDVTRYKNVELEIQKERILLRTLIDNLPDTIYVKDTEAKKIIANSADLHAIGVDNEADVLGKTDLELFENQIGLRGYNDDMQVLTSGVPLLNKEEFFYDKNGQKHWLLTSKVPVVDGNGEVIRILGIGRNITERKENDEAVGKLNAELNAQSQELSKQAADLKELNAQLTLQKEQELDKAIAQGKFEIASEVLHDIGNALVGFGSYLSRIKRVVDKSNVNSIKSLHSFVKSQEVAIAAAIGKEKAAALVAITEGLSKTNADNIQEISASVTELLNIIMHIQEILNIQRQFVRGHEGVHNRKPVNMAQLIDDCRAMLLASFEKKGIRLDIHIAAGNTIVKGDQTKLMQVLLNILKNSVEAIDHESPEKVITVFLSPLKDMLQLQITDNGQGFDEATGNRFFERGFTTKTSGTGLGLYNCRSIVESHSGSFEIKSEGRGLGAMTTMKLPVN